jgi:hypothetical protein
MVADEEKVASKLLAVEPARPPIAPYIAPCLMFPPARPDIAAPLKAPATDPIMDHSFPGYKLTSLFQHDWYRH